MKCCFNLAFKSILLVAIVVTLSFAGPSKCLSQSSDKAQTNDQEKRDDINALTGEWLYVADKTEGRPAENHSPPMSVKFELRVEGDVVVMPRRGKADNRMTLDGSTIEVAGTGTTTHYRGEWKNGVLRYETRMTRDSDGSQIMLIRREFRPTSDGLQVRVVVGDPAQRDSVAVYRHPDDIEMPKPAEATIDDLKWLGGAWLGPEGKSATEERWTPVRGGAMLGVSRTIRQDKMVAFEYLRIVQRDNSLVYVAQPGGKSPTEFALTEISANRAVFDNPRHDFPQRIVYEHSDGKLTASIGFINGGSPRKFEFKAEKK